MKTLSLGLALGCLLPVAALGAPARPPAHQAVASKQNKQAPQSKRKKKRHPVLSGFAVPRSAFRKESLPTPSGKLKLYAVNFRKGLTVDLYNADGTMNEDSLDELNHFFRCKKTGTEKPIEPQLFQILSIVQDHFEGRTIELVSGFRNQPRATSYHYHGTASDVRIPGVSDRVLHQFVASLDTGRMGLGLYPRAGFIHVDVRPQSYRWTDYSPPGVDLGHKKKTKPKRNT